MVSTVKHGQVTQCNMSNPLYKDGRPISCRIDYTEGDGSKFYTVYGGGKFLASYHDRSDAEKRYREYINALVTVGFVVVV